MHKKESLREIFLWINPSQSQYMVVGGCSDIICDIPRDKKTQVRGGVLGLDCVDSGVDMQKKNAKCQSAAVLLRSLGYHNSSLPVSTRVLITKTFVIPKIIYGLPTYPKLALSRENSIRCIDSSWDGLLSRILLKRRDMSSLTKYNSLSGDRGCSQSCVKMTHQSLLNR